TARRAAISSSQLRASGCHRRSRARSGDRQLRERRQDVVRLPAVHVARLQVRRALVIVLALAASAHADDKKLAEKYFRAGEKAYQAQSFEAAAQNFEQAYKSLPIAEIAFSAAQAYRRLYRLDAKVNYCARAVELYKVYLGKVKSGGR